jgi:hypothetical protein
VKDKEIAKPGEKKIVVVILPPKLVGQPGNVMFEWHGFENPNETMTRMEIASHLISLANSIINEEYMASTPKVTLARTIQGQVN